MKLRSMPWLALGALYVASAVVTSWLVFCAQRVYAQSITSTTPTQLTAAGVHTSCALSTASQTNMCLAGDGLWLSVNGGAYFQVTSAGTGTVTGVTINGVTKSGAVPSFTVTTTTTAPTATVSAPTTTVSVN